ncbi:hypothetical protein DINM_003709 [Dirofilaria immitis]|nr:hypothetical protein [Dirofilaria immitis]
MLIFVVLLTYIVNDAFGKLCPDIFGHFECPLNSTCIDNECYFNNNIISPNDCEQVECSIDSRCYKGRCYPAINLPCDRNVELSQHRSKSITSNCGQKGKCVNGRCVEDRCAGIMCTEDEICRDGKCLVITNSFCITHFDCGPIFKCYQNKCIPFRKPIPCNCDPGCAHVSCETGSFCLQGTCHSAIGQDCTRMACQGNTICVEGRCILDPCTNRCPSEHACREGQCRHLHGLLCLKECPKPYVCIDGLCIRNECFGKSCQPGEACQNGFCINVEKRLCSLAIRDCAEGFECIEGTCHDLLVIEVNTTTLS